jgi:hypothetical protein
MLTHVVRDWLSRVNDEREIDAALMAYLGASGYRDVHFTHGPQELGKDFIAKQDGKQYVFQSKSGDIGTGDWRLIREQMWEAVRIGLAHPSFDVALERRAVLVLTGIMRGGAREQIEKFNEELLREGRQPIEVWHREELVRRFTEIDPATIYPPNLAGYVGFGSFFTLYGEALTGDLTSRRIEKHSRVWQADVYERGHLLVPAVEASVITNACYVSHELYEAFQAQLGLVRVALDAAFVATGTADQSFFDFYARISIETACQAARRFAEDVWSARDKAHEKKLVHLAPSPIAYPVLCLRLGEALAFIYFCGLETERSGALSRLRKLVVTERGFEHPIGDWYTVSIIAIVRTLMRGGETAIAHDYLQRVSAWMVNMYSRRAGLADIWSGELDKIVQILGTAISEVAVSKRRGSFLVTALLDLCAFAQASALYSDVENDIRFHGIVPQYYRALDSRGQFRIDGDDVVHSVNVQFKPDLAGLEAYTYGEHLVDEPQTFVLNDRLGPGAHLALSLLLRDRYFPTTWS